MRNQQLTEGDYGDMLLVAQCASYVFITGACKCLVTCGLTNQCVNPL